MIDRLVERVTEWVEQTTNTATMAMTSLFIWGREVARKSTHGYHECGWKIGRPKRVLVSHTNSHLVSWIDGRLRRVVLRHKMPSRPNIGENHKEGEHSCSFYRSPYPTDRCTWQCAHTMASKAPWTDCARRESGKLNGPNTKLASTSINVRWKITAKCSGCITIVKLFPEFMTKS